MKEKGKKFKKKKAAALLVAILVSAIIGSAVLGINAIALRQVNISETYSNGLAAHYAAESGLEEGLLRYKFDKDSEIPAVIESTTDGSLSRSPVNGYRNFLSTSPMRPATAEAGTSIGYLSKEREEVYDYQVFYQQAYFGDDIFPEGGDGVISAKDIARYTNDTQYQINKDEAKVFSINSDSLADNQIYLYWQWRKNRTTASCNGLPRALEVKIKTKELNPISAENEYAMLFKDPRCPTIANAETPVAVAGEPGVYTSAASGDLKTKIGISSLTAIEMTLKPVGNSRNSGDGIFFGFDQGSSNSAKTTGAETTVRSIGYFAGASREITANIDRQTGTILDIFQYVVYKGQ